MGSTVYPGWPPILGCVHTFTKESTEALFHAHDMNLPPYERFGNKYFVLFEEKFTSGYIEQFLIYCLVKHRYFSFNTEALPK